jgi:hypothetical protein
LTSIWGNDQRLFLGLAQNPKRSSHFEQGGKARDREDGGGNAVNQPNGHAMRDAVAQEDNRYIPDHHAQGRSGDAEKKPWYCAASATVAI